MRNLNGLLGNQKQIEVNRESFSERGRRGKNKNGEIIIESLGNNPTNIFVREEN